MNMWFTKLIKQFFFWLDKIVYNFIPAIYDLLITIARTSVLTQADIADMADRIYKLLAIFMIFKVTLSLITYVVNPDDFSDKSKGVAKLGSNIIISLSLLILTPYLFSYAYQIQTIILEDNSLATLIFGGEEGDKEKSSFFNSAGDEMAFTTISAFFSPNLSLENLHECSRLTVRNDKNEYVFNPACSGYNDKYEDAGVEGSLSDLMPNSETLRNYVAGVELRNFGLMFRQDMALATNEDNTDFIMDYKFVFSTVVGVVVILLLITFCMDVAVRSLKLAFLQLIAPVPILSYVDPKSGKDGMFKKWYEMCFKTFLSLFIRLLALYFSVYIISKVAAMNLVDVIDGSYQTNALVAVFVIIGALMFAKDLPKILEGLGIKLDGGGKFTLNPFKKFENEALGGKRILTTGKGLAAAGLAGAAAFGTNMIAKKGNVLSATAGALSATGRGMVGAVKGEKFGANFSKSYGGAMKARLNRDDRRELGINGFDVLGENLKKTLYIPNQSQENKVKLDHLKEYTASGKAVKSRAEGEIDKKAAQITVDGKNLGALRDKYELLKNTQIDRRNYASDADYQRAVDAQAEAAAKANAEYFAARKKAVNAYVSSAQNLSVGNINIGGHVVDGFQNAFTGSAATDTIVSSNLGKMESLNAQHKMGQSVEAEDIGNTIQRAENATAEIEGSDDYRKAELIAQQAQKEKSSK